MLEFVVKFSDEGGILTCLLIGQTQFLKCRDQCLGNKDSTIRTKMPTQIGLVVLLDSHVNPLSLGRFRGHQNRVAVQCNARTL